MKAHKKLKLWLLITVFFVLTLTLFYLVTNKKTEHIDNRESAFINSPKSEEKIIIESPEGRKKISHDSDGENYTKGEISITAEWMRKVGKFTHQERADYANYSNDILLQLADAGDIKAMDALFTRYLAEGNTEKAWLYGEKQMIYGSISAIADMTILSQPNQLTPKDQINDKLIYTLALAKVIAMRGDENLSDIIRDNAIRTYNNDFHASVAIADLPALDQVKVDAAANDVMKNLKQKRLELGLGDFDTTPEAVKKFHRLISSH